MKPSPVSLHTYEDFLQAPTRMQWERFGLARRAGVSTPLFSLYSSKSLGIGELPDLKLLVDWCAHAGMSIIQLLPMNDVGFRFTPYDAQSTFALDPMYLRIESLLGVDAAPFAPRLEEVRRQFPTGRLRVDYGIKGAKLSILWDLFRSVGKTFPQAFQDFKKRNQFWLEDYVLFKILKEEHQDAGWPDWAEAYRSREKSSLSRFAVRKVPQLEFQRWLQWQLFEQFREVKQYAAEHRVYLMGDLPFLVSADSADVWSHQDYFKLGLSSGAPPDLFFANGQRWGMPPYDWPRIAENGYDYLREKVRYSESFYDMFRIDHVVGAFRLWTINLSEPSGNAGLKGRFDPEDEGLWADHGRTLLKVMIESSSMLPCAEDLGVVPDCSYRTLKEWAIPGMDVQRWTKYWDLPECPFKGAEEYRPNSIVVISNHDTTSFQGWWEFEAGTVDEVLFRRKCHEKGIDFDKIRPVLFDTGRSRHGRLRWQPELDAGWKTAQALERPEHEVGDLLDLHRSSFGEKQKYWNHLGLSGEASEIVTPALVRGALEKASLSRSIFSIQLLQDLLDLEELFEHDAWEYRINFPGSMGPHNWSLVIPISLEQWTGLKLNEELKRIHRLGGRT